MEEKAVKILVLHDRDGREIAANLLAQVKNHKIDGEVLFPDGDGGSSLAEALNAATHVLAVLSQAGSASLPWCAFAAGFVSGARVPFLLCGEEALSLSPWLAKAPVRCANEADFSAYLDREAEDWTREHALKQARDSLLEQGIPVAVPSLEHCIAEKNLEAVELFLQAGFSPDTLNQAAVPLLCLAARAGERGIVALLLKSGASVNLSAGDRGGSAIIDAALGKHTDILGDLLAAGADADAKSKDGQSALIIAVGLNDEAAVELLLKSGANVDDPDSLGVSARKYTALFNRPGMVELFRTYAPPPPQITGV
jgi:hypothetical protein